MGPAWIVIFGAGMMALGAWVLTGVIRRIRLGLNSQNWPTAPGRVTHSEIKRDDGYIFKVEYRYEVNGVSQYGDILEAGRNEYSRDQAEALAQSYAVGSDVEVHYDPADPSTSVLRPGVASAVGWGVVAGLMIAGFGIWLGVIGVGRLVEPSAPETETRPAGIFNDPTGIAVDSDGTVYICDGAPKESSTAPFPELQTPAWPGMTTTEPFPGVPPNPTLPGRTSGRVLRLSPDLLGYSNVVPWTLDSPTGLAFDKTGKIYVTQLGGGEFSYLGRLWVITEEKLPGSRNERRLTGASPLPNLFSAGGVAVDSAGTVYVTERSPGVVLRLAAGETKATEFYKAPEGGSAADVAVDSADNVYVTDDRKNRVLKFAASGGDPIVLPFGDLLRAQGVTVDTAGNVYVVDPGHHRVLKLAPGTQAPIELPFKELEDPYDVAVDSAGNVYVTDRGYRRVMKWSPNP